MKERKRSKERNIEEGNTEKRRKKVEKIEGAKKEIEKRKRDTNRKLEKDA